MYTNVQAAGAYRGYGATQGIFALESTVNELAEKLHIDPVELRLKILYVRACLCRHILARQPMHVHSTDA